MHPILKSLQTKTDDLTRRKVNRKVIEVYLKEELQDHILYALYSSPKTDQLIFYGGTCLRKIYQLNRLSEDLDFEDLSSVSFDAIADTVIGHFKTMKLEDIDFAVQTGKLIRRVTFRFPILNALGLSPHFDEKLYVKVETNPIKSAKNLFPTETTNYVFDQFATVVRHYPIDIMMAGKIGACLNRIWRKGKTEARVKGRDIFDLIWYMQKDIKPNLEKLNSIDPKLTISKAFLALDKKIETITPEALYIDLRDFFDNDKYIKDWCNHFHEFYARYRKYYH